MVNLQGANIRINKLIKKRITIDFHLFFTCIEIKYK